MSAGPISPIPPMNTKVYEMSADQAIEQEIQAKGLAAPRVTPKDLEAIASKHYFTAAEGVYGAQLCQGERPSLDEQGLKYVTICVLTTKNGTKLVGVNEGPVSPENFNAEIGRRLAREKAIDQLWLMLDYELRTKLAQPVLTEADAAADLAGLPRPSEG